MIHINLLKEKSDKTGLYALQLIGFGFGIVATVMVCMTMQTGLSGELDNHTNTRDTLNATFERLKEKTAKVEELQRKERLLIEKIRTIQRVKAKKQIPVHILDELTKTVPERAWVTSTAERGGTLEITGVALDNPTVSDFMLSLEHSRYFDIATLGFTEEYFHEGVTLVEFQLAVQLADALELQKKLRAENQPEKTKAVRTARENSASVASAALKNVRSKNLDSSGGM